MITQTRIPIVECRRGYYIRWYYNGWHHWNFLSGTVGYFTNGEKYRTTGIRTVELSSGVVNINQIGAIRSLLNSRESYLYTDGGWSECRVESGAVIVERNTIDAYELITKIRIGSRNVSPVGYSVGVTKQIITPPEPEPPVSPAFESYYVGRFNASGVGEIRLFGGLERTINVIKVSTGKYMIYQYLSSTNYISLGVSDDGSYPTSSLRAMSSIGVNNHFIYTSDDGSLNDSSVRFFLNYGDMANTKICVGEFNSAGTTITQLYGDALTLGITKSGTGQYDITHDIGHTNYIIMGVGIDSQTISLRAMDNILSTSVRVYTSDDSSLNNGGMRFIFIWQ